MTYEEIIMEYKAIIIELQSENSKYFQALTLIAEPVRSDGTFNRCREACQQLAAKAISESNYEQ